MKIDLQVRDLTTGDRGPQAFASAEEAKKWLVDRPKNKEVLGLASEGVARETSDELKAAMRPLDAEEKLLLGQLEAAEEAAAKQRAEERMKQERAEAEKHRAELKNADPNRPMELRYVFNKGLAAVEDTEERPISDEVKAVVKAWVEERNEWVASRNQVVGDARLSVWPAVLPAGKTERIIHGTFVPVTAPPKA